MAILGTFKEPDYGSSVSINDIVIGVSNKLPHALLDLKFTIYAEPSSFSNKSKNGGPSTATIIYSPEVCEIKFRGNPISTGIYTDGGISMTSYDIKMPLSIESIKYIEANRKDDLLLEFYFKFSYFLSIDNHWQNKVFSFPPVIRFAYQISHAKWIELLRLIGYADRMLIELEKPDIKGYEKVVELIYKANDGLINHSSPDSIISDLRSAWDAMDPFLNEYKTDIKRIINAGSRVEEGKPPKDDRIEAVKDAISDYVDSIKKMKYFIDQFTQIGPHKEHYKSTRDDAELAFRLTASMMAYFSHILDNVERGGSQH